MRTRRNQTLKPRWFQILLALTEADRHGSEIVRTVLEQTDGDLRLWPAMLYGSLEQMMDEGLIAELAIDERPSGAGRRRFFRITPHGRGMLAQEADRLAALARVARAKNTLGEEESV